MNDAQEIKTIHREAMEKTDHALEARQRGEVAVEAQLLREAFDLESKAAKLASGLSEPTRSVLLRSAASLALDCNLLVEAEKSICVALAGDPPNEIAEELRDLLEQVNFKRHLRLRGITLQAGEIQMSIAGRAVGYGIARADAFTDRVEKTERLLYRTVERTRRMPFRERGMPDRAVRGNFELYLSVPRAASFAVTFRVGGSEQLNLFGLSNAEQVIDELLECLDIFNHGDEAQLKGRITEEPYYRNFVGLARGIAPDGEEVDLVGFTTVRRGEVREVALKAGKSLGTSLAADLSVLKPSSSQQESVIEISGVLKYADSLKEGKDKIQILDVSNVPHSIVVPPGMMSDIVKPLWETDVTVTGILRGKTITLQNIRPRSSEASETR